MSTNEAVERLLDGGVGTPSVASATAAPAWLVDRRREGAERFRSLGLPTRKNEDWKQTRLDALGEWSFHQPVAEHEGVSALVDAHRIPGAHCLVLVNGAYAEQLSDGGALPEGVRLEALSALIEREGASAADAIGSVASVASRPLVALNAAHLDQGIALSVAATVLLEQPIQLLHLVVGPAEPLQLQLRHLVRLERGAAATLIETYVGPQGPRYLQNVVCEVLLGDNARLDRYKLELEGEGSMHLASFDVRQGRDSQLRSHVYSLAAGLSRNEQHVALVGTGAACFVGGLSLARGDQTVDQHPEVDHQSPHCRSQQLFKGILAERAHGVFNGKIFVREKAVGTDARQQNSNLLLSREAVVNTKPQLEIFADDVKCSHGATVGQLDEDALFYLRARGIGLAEARRLLMIAFAAELVDGCRVEALRERLGDLLAERLS